MRLLFLLTGLSIILGGCSTETQPAASQPPASGSAAPTHSTLLEPPETGQPALHAIRNQHLQHLMTQMNALVFQAIPNQLQATREEHLRTQEIANTAAELSNTVKSIIETLPTLNLNPEEQASFLGLSNKLQFYARQMETQAKAGQILAITATMEQVTETCSACHSLFRKKLSPLERCRDPHYTC